jgi:predicted ATPase
LEALMEIGMRGAARDSGSGSAALVERDRELAALERCLEDAARGIGRVAVIEGPAGSGKTRLLEELSSRAAGAGLQVLNATGSELEGQFPFGVAIQLCEGCWAAADDAQRDALGTGPANLACALLNGQLPPSALTGEEHFYPVIHGLLAFVRNLLATRSPANPPPLAIFVDDAQRADAQSLRFLAYLAARLETLPICLVVAVCPGEDAFEPLTLDALRATANTSCLALRGLSQKGTGRVRVLVLHRDVGKPLPAH